MMLYTLLIVKWVSLLAEDATTAQVVGVVNTLLKQFRNSGLIQL